MKLPPASIWGDWSCQNIAGLDCTDPNNWYVLAARKQEYVCARARTLAYDFTIRIQEVGAHWFVASPSYCRWEQEVEKQQCEDCPANTMSAAAGATSCQECAPGSVSSPGAATCTQCEAGKYVGQGGGAVVRDEGRQCNPNSWLGQSSAMGCCLVMCCCALWHHLMYPCIFVKRV